MKKSKTEVRLSTDIVPEKYEIKLKPDLEAFVFEGEETIHLALKERTKAITLHAKELEIESAEVLAGKETFLAEKISYDEKAETATLAFKRELPKGAARLKLVFRGALNDKMRGFYRSSYAHEGTRRHLATTQFESTDARRAFPCFDEPAMKAVFEVSLIVPSSSTAISNTVPVEILEHAGGYRTVSFAPTPPMSTYLLAFLVGDFEHIEKKSKDGVLVRVFTTPGKKHQARFALDCAAKIVSFFNEYFDIPYPLPVLDLIAIPDFAAGAMENWGAITYRESALLVDPEHSSTRTKQWVALVIAHELAHQWFGNLVTMEWWTHLWLNEGFASYIEYLAVDHVFPRWDIWTQFLVADTNVALNYDGLKHSHPIEVEVRHPAEIASVFDAVSYSKGAAILRMIAEYLGEEKFRDGLRHYLKKHSYKTAATEDLWRALAVVSNKPVAKIMANWTRKPGYPLLSLTEKKRGFELRQSRFFASAISEKRTKDGTLWHVPISFMHGAKKGQELLNTRTYAVPGNDPRLKLNMGETALFRTSYPKRVREKLGTMVRAKDLKTRDRLGLARDAFALAESGKLSSTEALRFARHYKKEREYAVWATMAGGLAKIRALAANEPFAARYEAFVRDLFADIGKTMDWKKAPKGHSRALLRVLVLETLGAYGEEKTVARARKLFSSTTKNVNGIPADLRSVVYDTIARHGGRGEYDKLLQMYKAATLHEEKNRIGHSLGQFRQKALLEKTLSLGLSRHVRPQDSVRMVAVASVNPGARDLAWAFIKRNWKKFQTRYAGTRELSHLLEPLGLSTSPRRAKDIERFLKKNPAPGTERTVQQVAERIRSNAVWLARDKKKLAAFLGQ